MLYPENSRLLIGLSTAAGNISSIMPLLWHHLIASGTTNFTTIMSIWTVLTFASLMLCIFISPWHTLKHFPEGETVKQLLINKISTTSSNLDQSNTGIRGKCLE